MKNFNITYFNVLHFFAGIAVGYILFEILLN